MIKLTPPDEIRNTNAIYMEIRRERDFLQLSRLATKLGKLHRNRLYANCIERELAKCVSETK